MLKVVSTNNIHSFLFFLDKIQNFLEDLTCKIIVPELASHRTMIIPLISLTPYSFNAGECMASSLLSPRIFRLWFSFQEKCSVVDKTAKLGNLKRQPCQIRDLMILWVTWEMELKRIQRKIYRFQYENNRPNTQRKCIIAKPSSSYHRYNIISFRVFRLLLTFSNCHWLIGSILLSQYLLEESMKQILKYVFDVTDDICRIWGFWSTSVKLGVTTPSYKTCYLIC
jgi:hypothetical protein